jgi:ribosomal protein L11 methyltransferase
MNTPDGNRNEWLKISLGIDAVAHEAVSAFFFDLGCPGLVSQDFQDFTIQAYLPSRGDTKEVRNRIEDFLVTLHEIFPEISPPKLTLSTLPGHDWSLTWRQVFHPERVTPRLWVVPAWESHMVREGFHVIRMEPGPAFGTGRHPTTRMCLKAMERVPLPKRWTMLDVGTGSGILAMYGAIMGACKVLGIDLDQEALRWAERNVDLNLLSPNIRLSPEPIVEISDQFTLVTANLVLDTILSLMPQFYRTVEPSGWLILSGILGDQTEEAYKSAAAHGFLEEDMLLEEEWACLVLKNP